MAKAQQKPKNSSDGRNSGRRNGKAPKKNPKESRATGKSIVGYHRDRVAKWAAERGITLEEMTAELIQQRDHKKAMRAQVRRDEEVGRKTNWKRYRIDGKPSVTLRVPKPEPGVAEKMRKVASGGSNDKAQPTKGQTNG